MWQAYVAITDETRDHEPCTTREDADRACAALGWTVVEEIDAAAGVWGVDVPKATARVLRRDGGIEIERGAGLGVIELP